MDLSRRFGGIARLYGEAGLARLAASHVCVIGIGGVGSWVAESLARSAVGAITLIDMDLVAESNINRQLVATTDNIGRDKGLVMQERILQINPACAVTVVDEFVSRDNLAQLIAPSFDYVIDCIDDFRTKAALINHCRQTKIKVLTVGGAGGQLDPSKIKQCDLSRTKQDVLLARTRKLLRQDYGFARNLKRSFGVPCVYSDEQLVYPDGVGGVARQRPTASGRSEGTANGNDAENNTSNNAANANETLNNALNCAGGMGSITHVTGSFAFVAAGFVLTQLAHAR